MKNIILMCAILVVSGCGNTGPLKLGPETYTILTDTAFGGRKGALVDAIKTGNAYCASLGKEFLITDVRTISGGYSVGDAQVNFSCLSPDDPKLKQYPVWNVIEYLHPR